MPFEPHQSFSKSLHFSRDDLVSCMDFVATKMLQTAEKHKCPVIDLSRTLNPFDAAHYGQVPKQPEEQKQQQGPEEMGAPSLRSGQFIVDLVIKVLSVWDWNDQQNKSQIYYGRKEEHGLQTADNDKAYRQSYFNVVQSRSMHLDEATICSKEMDLLADLFSPKADK